MISRANTRVPLLGLLLGCAWLLGDAGTAAATTENIRVALKSASEDVKQFLKGRGEESIAVGAFNAPAQLATGSGTALTKVMAEELQKTGLSVKIQANFSVEGRFRDTKTQDKSLVAEVRFKILDRQDNVVHEFTHLIKGQETLAHIFNPTVALSPAAPTQKRDRDLEKAIRDPHAHVMNTKVAAAPNSPYFVEILVKKKGAGGVPPAREAALQEGRPFVNINVDEVYQVKLYNESDYEAAVLLTIDGLNFFTFSDVKNASGQPRYSRVIIPARGHFTVPGWHKTNQQSLQFLVTSYPEAAAVKLGQTANVGVITATFSAAWPKDSTPPHDEVARTSTSTGTGLGPPIAQRYQEVQRTIGLVRAAVSIRYAR